MMLLREGLLRGRSVVLAGFVGPEVRGGLERLEATVVDAGGQADALVYDSSAAFARGEEAGLAASLQEAWDAIAALASATLIPSAHGKVILVGPRPDAGAYAEAARAALENLARTLSVEWARYGTTSTAIMPGVATADRELATLVAFLLSPAGDYFSGCRFELGV